MPPSRKDIMTEKQCVILKGRRDGISILLDDKAEFELIKGVMRKRVADSRNFFEGAKATVTFKGRKLTEAEEQTLLDIIQFESNLNVTVSEEAPPPLLLTPASPIGMQPQESNTFYYKGGLRSGQSVKQNGSVTIIGDVNPGAEVKATGNIIILGRLKGTAWAGCPGDNGSGGDAGCFISALDFKPTQIRIARYVTYIPEDAPQVQQGDTGAWAYIHDGLVYITPL